MAAGLQSSLASPTHFTFAEVGRACETNFRVGGDCHRNFGPGNQHSWKIVLAAYCPQLLVWTSVWKRGGCSPHIASGGGGGGGGGGCSPHILERWSRGSPD